MIKIASGCWADSFALHCTWDLLAFLAEGFIEFRHVVEMISTASSHLLAQQLLSSLLTQRYFNHLTRRAVASGVVAFDVELNRRVLRLQSACLKEWRSFSTGFH